MKTFVRIIAQEIGEDYWGLRHVDERREGMSGWHVHQKHNNVSIKIELASIEAPR